jgi:hypothetical protein
MAEHGDELFPQPRLLAFACQRCRTRGEAGIGVEMESDDREQPEHTDDFRRIKYVRFWIDRTQSAEKRPIRQENGHRYVALEPYIAGV